MEARVEGRALRHELVPGLVAGDRLVLGAVVLEHPPEIADSRDRPDVGEEDRDPDRLFDQHEHDRAAELILPDARDRHGQDEEQADRERERQEHRKAPGPLRDLLVGLVQLRVCGDAKGLHPDRE